MRGELSLRQQTLLVFLNSDPPRELDPVRIMKALFVFAMEMPGALPAGGVYEFVPYHWGPYSPQIYGDLDSLTYAGYITATRREERSWKYYSITPQGVALAHSIAETFDPKAVEYLNRLREFVTQLSFSQLLVKIYERYPAYAVKSVFQY